MVHSGGRRGGRATRGRVDWQAVDVERAPTATRSRICILLFFSGWPRASPPREKLCRVAHGGQTGRQDGRLQIRSGGEVSVGANEASEKLMGSMICKDNEVRVD